MPVTSNNMRRTVKLRDTCDSCAQSKVKCNRGRPCCQRCLLRGLDCHYSPCRRLGRPGMSSPTTSTTSNDSEVLEHTIVPEKTPNFAFVDDDYAGRPTLNISVDIDTPLSFADPVEPMWLQPMSTPPAPWDFPMQDWPTPTDASPSSATTGPSSTSTSPLCDAAAEAAVAFPWPQFPSSPTCTTCAPRALAAFQSITQARGPSMTRPSCRRRHMQADTSLPPSPASPSLLPEPAYLTTTTTNNNINNIIHNTNNTSSTNTSTILHATASAIAQVHSILSCSHGACAASDRAVTLLLLLICAEATHAYQRLATTALFSSAHKMAGKASHRHHHHQSADDGDDGGDHEGGNLDEHVSVSVGGYVTPRRRAQRKMVATLLLDELVEVARAMDRIDGSREDNHGGVVDVGDGKNGKACGCTAAVEDAMDGRLTGGLGVQLRDMMGQLRGELGAVLGLGP